MGWVKGSGDEANEHAESIFLEDLEDMDISIEPSLEPKKSPSLQPSHIAKVTSRSKSKQSKKGTAPKNTDKSKSLIDKSQIINSTKTRRRHEVATKKIASEAAQEADTSKNKKKLSKR